jgi:prophage regulatory protein
MNTQFLRTSGVLNVRGIGKSLHHVDVREGRYVSPVKRGERIALYPSNEVEALNAAELAGKSESDIRELVKFLHSARQRNPIAVYLSFGRSIDEIKQLVFSLNEELEILEKEGCK